MTDTSDTATDSGRPLADPNTPVQPEHREAHDAEHKPALKRNPSDPDAKLDIELDETFPSSDPPSNTQPGKGSDPAPSSGYNGG
ncbi:hypothetical protein [Polymorphobacter megasporae]|uniref:hypothetical protein n=1 Tax=Glacieibacterium megasporae TaxID=2835787 RepID=UPI001C1DE08B|nr:hypothetical protein [Polymorphobacter megasporae]UAJ09154.1 hypothetical protein KTC28_12455 [Polymorphobacter megasporae]